MGGYRSGAHPDLTSVLYDLIPDPAVRKAYAFGKPMMASPTGLVFAYVGGHALHLPKTARRKI